MKYGCYEYSDLPNSYKRQADCSICENLSLTQTRSDYYGKKQCYCKERGTYIKKDGEICRSVLISRSNYNRLGSYRPSGWHITTVICDILDEYGQKEKYNTDLTRLLMMDFCENHLQDNPDTANFLREYDEVGPKIANCIRLSNDKYNLCVEIYEYYLVPFICELQEANYSNAIIIYIDMLNNLNTKFGLSPLNMNTNNEYNLENLGPQKLLMPRK